jgi:quercetin dioxygenase-like cupin family protein
VEEREPLASAPEAGLLIPSVNNDDQLDYTVFSWGGVPVTFIAKACCIPATGLLAVGIAWTQEEPVCFENSPERRGEIGCSIVEKKPLPATLKEPAFWHIDKFESADGAQAGVGLSSIAFEAHGAWWLMSIGPKSKDHHGGSHVAEVNLSPLPKADGYSMLVISAYIPGGMTSRVHFHSGVEGFYTVDGEQCLETKDEAFPMKRGDTLVVPTGITMRLVATGTKPRRAFAVIVYDSSKPPVTRLPMETASQLVSCAK